MEAPRRQASVPMAEGIAGGIRRRLSRRAGRGPDRLDGGAGVPAAGMGQRARERLLQDPAGPRVSSAHGGGRRLDADHEELRDALGVPPPDDSGLPPRGARGLTRCGGRARPGLARGPDVRLRGRVGLGQAAGRPGGFHRGGGLAEVRSAAGDKRDKKHKRHEGHERPPETDALGVGGGGPPARGRRLAGDGGAPVRGEPRHTPDVGRVGPVDPLSGDRGEARVGDRRPRPEPPPRRECPQQRPPGGARLQARRLAVAPSPLLGTEPARALRTPRRDGRRAPVSAIRRDGLPVLAARGLISAASTWKALLLLLAVNALLALALARPAAFSLHEALDPLPNAFPLVKGGETTFLEHFFRSHPDVFGSSRSWAKLAGGDGNVSGLVRGFGGRLLFLGLTNAVVASIFAGGFAARVASGSTADLGGFLADAARFAPSSLTLSLVSAAGIGGAWWGLFLAPTKLYEAGELSFE